MRKRKRYPSDITREQFEKIRPILASARKKTKPTTIDQYDIFCAVLYVLKTGCQWRALPHEYPKWSSAYSHFHIWKEKKGNQSVLQEVLKKISWRGATEQWTDRVNQYGHR